MNTAPVIQEIKRSVYAVSWLTPQNLVEERAKFLKQPTRDPQLVYPEFDAQELQDHLDLLCSITPNNSVHTLEGWIHMREIEELKLQLQLFLHLHDDEFSEISCRLYECSFRPDFVEQAKKDASSPLPFISQETRTPQQIIDDIKTYLEEYGIFDWTVELTEATDFYFRIQGKTKQILISKRFNWDFCDFDNSLAHEIDGHVLRAVNAALQTNPLLRKPLPFYIKTEEGLASFLGDYCSTTAEISKKHHALKYLAGNLAKTSSFTTVFEFLVDSGFTPDLAFQRTFRLKRGISDTQRPGLFAKEAMYYEGMLEVKDYLDKGGSVEKLYSGKVGLQDLPFIEVPKNGIVPERLKNIYRLHRKNDANQPPAQATRSYRPHCAPGE